jgi:hypothetical protein
VRAHELIDAMKECGMPFDTHISIDGNKICIGVVLKSGKFPFKPIRNFLEMAQEVFGDNWIDLMKNGIKGNQYIDFNLRLGTTVGAVLKKGAGSTFSEFLKGV